MMRRFSARRELIFLGSLALFTWWIRYHPPGVELPVFDDDARQHVYWTARFQDPDLFPNDLLTEFISSYVFNPPGYQLLYWLGTRVMDPLPFSQLLTLFLLLASLWLLDELARGIIPDPRGQLVCAGLFLLSPSTISGGFSRSFAVPLLLAFLVILQKGAFRWAVATMLLEMVLYPPILLNTLALAGWEFLSRWSRGVRGRRGIEDLLCLIAVLVVAWVLLFSVYGNTDRTILGRQVTLEEAKAMPEFHPDGRIKFFWENLAAYLLKSPSGIGAKYLIGFVILLGIMGIIAGPRRVRIPALALNLVWTSLLLFVVAHLALFQLYHPSRYIQYTFPLAFMIAIGASTAGFLEALRPTLGWLREKGLKGYAVRQFRWGMLGVLALICAQVHAIYGVKTLVALEQVDQEMIAFLRSLPKDALVMGHPSDMDNVPLLARRKVLANTELSLPFYLGYYTQVRKRLFDFFDAYYATRWEAVEGFVRHYGVEALVVRKEHFQKPFLEGRIYFEPFNRAVKGRLKGGERFVLAEPPERLRCFENERYVVLCWGHTEGS